MRKQRKLNCVDTFHKYIKPPIDRAWIFCSVAYCLDNIHLVTVTLSKGEKSFYYEIISFYLFTYDADLYVLVTFFSSFFMYQAEMLTKKGI